MIRFERACNRRVDVVTAHSPVSFPPPPPRTTLTAVRALLTIPLPPSKFIVRCEPMRILVAADDAPLAEFLHRQFQQEQFSVELAADAGEVERIVANELYDLVIVDFNSRADSGLDVLRGIRAKRPDLPVVMVAAANLVEDRVRLLNAGADDSLAKPFAFAELAARVRAVLRRGNRPARAILKIADLEVDRVSHLVQRAGHSIELSPKEFALLEFLMRHAGQPVTRTAIVEQVWKLNFDTITNVVDVYINYLRRKIDSGFDRALIRTIRGVGYQIGGNGSARQ